MDNKYEQPDFLNSPLHVTNHKTNVSYSFFSHLDFLLLSFIFVTSISDLILVYLTLPD